MDIISLAREIGKEIQKDERYLNMQLAKQNSDDDQQLQDLIGEFNLKRMAINNEAQKPEQDSDKMQVLNQELRHVYAQIMQNPNMTAYNRAKEEMDALLQRVSAIIGQSADGEDPETTDYVESSCGGNCSSCGGCH
ncbi:MULTISPECIES: YlbF family regulator [unclassified Caproiciproducens]|uniref:YlbF family regulator n=1 Tax=unclassified Caproiciproducens TaxID=2643836 RepID=UPI0023DA9A45|nr:YlbF family regulator [Caproiciproducens sp. CPB-2]MDF1495740.1 YlbF family regulator [Caproiciproducens sp. CPB-2]